jgi:hypothetical protein
MNLGSVLDLVGGAALGVCLTGIVVFTALTNQRESDRWTDKRRLWDAKRRRLRAAYIRLARAELGVRDLRRMAKAMGDAGLLFLHGDMAIHRLAQDLRMDVETVKLAVLLEKGDRDAEQALVQLDTLLADLAYLTNESHAAPVPPPADRPVDRSTGACEELVAEFDDQLAIARNQLADFELPL